MRPNLFPRALSPSQKCVTRGSGTSRSDSSAAARESPNRTGVQTTYTLNLPRLRFLRTRSRTTRAPRKHPPQVGERISSSRTEPVSALKACCNSGCDGDSSIKLDAELLVWAFRCNGAQDRMLPARRIKSSFKRLNGIFRESRMFLREVWAYQRLRCRREILRPVILFRHFG